MSLPPGFYPSRKKKKNDTQLSYQRVRAQVKITGFCPSSEAMAPNRASDQEIWAQWASCAVMNLCCFWRLRTSYKIGSPSWYVLAAAQGSHAARPRRQHQTAECLAHFPALLSHRVEEP